MQGKYIYRKLHPVVKEYLSEFPAVAILGPRQCGKTTLAKAVVSQMGSAVYLDLEKPSDVNKLHEPELFFKMNRNKLVCLDEIQRALDIFTVLRSVIDEGKRNGQFLILGSASPDLIKQSAETLAGRIAYLELPPFMLPEIIDNRESDTLKLYRYWLRGGFPRSVLADSDAASFRWRKNFILTFLERDIPQLGFRIPAESLRRLWSMLAHYHGQLLNLSKIGESLGASHPTIRSYIDILTGTYMVRLLPPFAVNLKKRLVKSPKIYIRDAGILHALLDLENQEDLMGHPTFGASWEGMVIENVLNIFEGWKTGFYRTAAGAELDLVLEKRGRRLGIECKASASPGISKGFRNALQDLKPENVWIIAPVDSAYPIDDRVMVSPLDSFLTDAEKMK